MLVKVVGVLLNRGIYNCLATEHIIPAVARQLDRNK